MASDRGRGCIRIPPGLRGFKGRIRAPPVKAPEWAETASSGVLFRLSFQRLSGKTTLDPKIIDTKA